MRQTRGASMRRAFDNSGGLRFARTIGQCHDIGEALMEPCVADWLSLTTGEFADRARIAVLPVAAVEQHGPHLPVGVDTYIAEAYLKHVRALLPQESPVAFLPVQ